MVEVSLRGVPQWSPEQSNDVPILTGLAFLRNVHWFRNWQYVCFLMLGDNHRLRRVDHSSGWGKIGQTSYAARTWNPSWLI